MHIEVTKSTNYPAQFNLEALSRGTASAEGVWMEESKEWQAAAQLVADALQ